MDGAVSLSCVENIMRIVFCPYDRRIRSDEIQKDKKEMFISEEHKIEATSNRICFSIPTMHGAELAYMKEVFENNWMSTIVGIVNF